MPACSRPRPRASGPLGHSTGAWFGSALIAMCLLTLPVAAQLRLPPSPRSSYPAATAPESQQDGATTIRVDVNLVQFPVTVTDGYGRYVGTLGPQHFRLYEDGAPQRIALFKRESVPVSVGIVIDTSGSMVPKLDQAVDALDHFVDTIQPDDDVFLMRFSSNVELMLDFTNDRQLFHSAARQLRAVGATRLYDAIADAIEHIRGGRHQKKALLVITDGQDTSSSVGFQEVLRMAQQSEVLLYCIGIGQRERTNPSRRFPMFPLLQQRRWPGNWPIPWPIPTPGSPRIPSQRNPGRNDEYDTVDMRVLEALADATGGRAFHLDNIGGNGPYSIDSTAQQVSAELRQQYTVGYYPTNAARDGTYRRIELQAAVAGVNVRHRRGYYAPSDGQVGRLR